MKRLFILTLICFIPFLSANDRKRIFILHSYSQEYTWTKLQHTSFISTLENSSSYPLDISVEYLDTKRLKYSPEYQSFFSDYLSQKYKGYTPDAIYVSDDNALTFFLNPHRSLFPDIPVFFSGVNDLSLEKTIDPNKYCGVFETKDIVPNIELIRQFSPQTRDIWIVGDNSTTYRSIELDIRKYIKQYPNYTFHFIASEHIHDIISKLPSHGKTFVLLTTIGGLMDDDGHNLTLKESIEHFKQNSNLILCSTEDSYVRGGVIGGYVTSGTSQGSHAAELLSRYLNGEPLNKIRSVTKSPNVYMFDRQALMKSRLILSEYTARNAIILQENKTFFVRHQNIILDTIFILSIVFFLVMIVVFFMILQKNKKAKKLESQLEQQRAEITLLSDKLSSCQDNAYE